MVIGARRLAVGLLAVLLAGAPSTVTSALAADGGRPRPSGVRTQEPEFGRSAASAPSRRSAEASVPAPNLNVSTNPRPQNEPAVVVDFQGMIDYAKAHSH